jgi:8-oxo-dGTP pyrophosphatase MutT (NUDIX family)
VTPRIAVVALVDARGWILLQERDEGAPVDPDRWSLVGGGVEEGESPAEAAVRELEEETGLTGIDLTPLGTATYWCTDHADWHDAAVFGALTQLTDDDVECHEGRQIVFVDPGTVDGLRWSRGLVAALPMVMGSDLYADRFGRREPQPFGCVLLVDERGWVLLQERDEHAPIDPDKWGLPGGHLDPGEDPETGAYREVEEETGVRLDPGTLRLFGTVHPFHPSYGSVDDVHVFTALVDLSDADIDCREGRQIVFVDPNRVRGLELTMAGALVVPEFLESEEYAALVAETP